MAFLIIFCYLGSNGLSLQMPFFLSFLFASLTIFGVCTERVSWKGRTAAEDGKQS